jgi:serine/threonine-protein kinase
VLVLGMFVYSLAAYPAEFQNGCVCDTVAGIDQRDGVFRLHTPYGSTGPIQDYDALIAVNGIPIKPDRSASEIFNLLNDGKIGSSVMVTVISPYKPARDITLTRSEAAYWVVAGILDIGGTVQTSVIYVYALEIFVMLVYIIVASLIAWRNSSDWMALFAAWTLIAAGFGGGQLLTALRINTLVPPAPFVTVSNFKAAMYVAIYAFALLFPDGRFRPRWTIGLVAGFGLWQLFLRVNLSGASRFLLDFVIFLFIAAFIVAARYRYKTFFSATRRQQTKWVLFGMIVMLLVMQVIVTTTALLNLYAPREQAVRFFLVGYPLSRLILLLLPLTFTFAAFRYRLYDINIIINRSLVYGLVTMLLAAVFLGVGLGLQRILGQEQSTTAFAISVIGAGLLFNPARRQAQRVVDRRLYGFRFDLNELHQAQQQPEIKHPGAMTGKIMGDYRLLGVLGRGGMGEVYQGEGSGRKAAIKILPIDLANQDDYLKRFEREAQTLALFDHPHIVKVYGTGFSEGMYYIIEEFIEGRELSDLIREHGRLSFDEVKAFMDAFAPILDYAHERGLVHRDIKPSNIMLRGQAGSGTFDPVLMDFGIAKIRDVQTQFTGTGAIGTIDYMAPEQITTASEVDHRADIYALGVVVYEMLTGACPFKGNPGQVLFAHLYQPPPDPRHTDEDIPKHVAHAIIKALAKSPQDRFHTAGAFASALNKPQS